MKQYNLGDLHTFMAVVEAGSFHQAAERMNTSAASVSRRISGLERALNARLLQRTTRQLHLTEAGQQYYTDLQQALGFLQEAEDKLRGQTELSGSLRLAAPMSFGFRHLAPLLPDFLRQHPALRVHLHLEDSETDLYAEGIDLAVRIGEMRDSSLVATQLGSIKLSYYAAPDYLKQYGTPAVMADLHQHQCLHYSLVHNRQEWGVEHEALMPQVVFSANNGEALCEAAVQGMGIVMLPSFIAKVAVQQGQLTPILLSSIPEPLPVYAVRLSRQFTPMKVTLMLDYLRDQLHVEL